MNYFIELWQIAYNHRYFFNFYRFDAGNDGYLDLSELKRMMEVLGAPQTHLGLKAMIQEVDEDGDGRISFREVSYFYRISIEILTD